MTDDDFYSQYSTADFDGEVVKRRRTESVVAGLETYGSGYSLDYWRRYRRPNASDLVDNFKRVAFSCASINADSVTQIPIRLYVKTDTGDREPRIRTRSLTVKQIDYLNSRPYLHYRLKEAKNVEEVTRHPLLELLQKANQSSFLNGTRLLHFTQLYQEITGACYWLIGTNAFDLPNSIWILPTQYVCPERILDSPNIVDYYKFQNGRNETKYRPDEIIPFLMPNLDNPYLEGLSPLGAAWESNRVSSKLIAHEDNFLENDARPDFILSPGKDVVLGESERERWERKINHKFGRGQSGRMMVAEEEVNLLPITFPPRDLARLEINKWTKLEIANAFGVPIALMEGENINRQTLEAAMMQHARFALKPRLERLVSVLNDQLVSRFDKSGRLFFGFDDPVPEDREQKMQETVQFKINGIISANEARDRHDMQPHPDAHADDLRTAQDAKLERDAQRQNGSAEK